MPLHNKKEFEREPPPTGLDPSTKVFYLAATKEVFLTHEKYFNRMIQLNSTIWSCSYTRKTNLTFFEALESEKEALRSLNHFPHFLEKPILFIVKNYTNRGRFDDLVNDIYYIMKDRFFIHEELTFSEKSRKHPAKIVQSYLVNRDMNHSSSMVPSSSSDMKDVYLPPPECFNYSVQILEGLAFGDDGLRDNVTHDRLFRAKNVGSRQKIKLFLKNSCYIPLTGDHYLVKEELLEDGSIDELEWRHILCGNVPDCPNTPALQKGRIPNTQKPGFDEEETVEKKKKKEVKDSDEAPKPRGRPPKRIMASEERIEKKRRLTKDKNDEAEKTPKIRKVSVSKSENNRTPTKKGKRSVTPRMSAQKKKKILEQQEGLEFFFNEAIRLNMDVSKWKQEEKLLTERVVNEFKQNVKEAKEQEKERIKEEKRQKNKEKADYNKKRDDLICDDLKPMPRFPSLELPNWMSDDEFSDIIFIMQFFRTFKEILPLKEIRNTTEVSFTDIVIAIKCNDPQNSSYADLIRVMLSIRTDIADEEDGDEADIGNRDEIYLINTQSCDPANPIHGDSIRDSCGLHFTIRKTHGKSVRHLPVDWMTLSEVLRLIFLTSGYYTGSSTHRHRLYNRGNFKGFEDPGYEFRNKNQDLMDKLRTQTVFDLEPMERLEIMKTLVYQLLTYAKFRNHIESKQNDVSELKKEQRKLKAWDATQEQEANVARLAIEASIEVEKTKVSPRKKVVVEPAPAIKKLKSYLKASNEGRRFDKHDLETILQNGVPFGELNLDEILTARSLQKAETDQQLKGLTDKMFDAYATIGDLKLGEDRAHRRYILLEKMNAILIETSHEDMPVCENASMLKSDDLMEEDEESEVFICEGDEEDCMIHGEQRKNRPKWCYIKSCEQFEKLLSSLNPRGFRESELIEELNEYKQDILNMLATTELDIDSGEWKNMFMTDAVDPSDTYNISWNIEIREILLDFEEKVNQGRMGSLEKTLSVNRVQWRELMKDPSGDVNTLLTEDLMIGNDVGIDLVESKEYSDVKKGASAFFQIIKTIGLKFIKPPFTSIAKDENGQNYPKESELYVRWKRALMGCESFSALALFLSTLEVAIQWDKSRLQGNCHHCRKKGVAEQLVLCTECNNCYHLICVKLPENEEAPCDWMCGPCKAQRRKLENEAKRRARAEEMEEEMEEDIKIGSITLDESVLSQSSEAESGRNLTRTSSGRAVKKIMYSELLDGKTLKSKQRKSNGSAIPSERPTRSITQKHFDDYDENTSIDEDDDIMSDRRKSNRKKSSARASAVYEPRPSATTNREKMVALESLIKETMRQEFCWPFLEPVDSKEIPDYYDVIKRPMDLRTMMNKLKQIIYNDPNEVRNDFDLIIDNCATYNGMDPDNEVYLLSRELHDFMSSRLDTIIDG